MSVASSPPPWKRTVWSHYLQDHLALRIDVQLDLLQALYSLFVLKLGVVAVAAQLADDVQHDHGHAEGVAGLGSCKALLAHQGQVLHKLADVAVLRNGVSVNRIGPTLVAPSNQQMSLGSSRGDCRLAPVLDNPSELGQRHDIEALREDLALQLDRLHAKPSLP